MLKILTYKELADKLGVKKEVIKYRASKLPKGFIIQKEGTNYLTENAVRSLTETIKGLNHEAAPKTEHNQAYDLLVEQLAIKDTQIEKLQQLLDQQQQLTASLQTRLDDTQKQLTTVEAQKHPKHWWDRFFE